MRIQATRGAETVQLIHAAGFFDTQRALVAQIEPLVGKALERDEPVVLGVRPITEEALRSEFGGSVELVPLAQCDTPDAASGQTVAGKRARQLRTLTQGGTQPVTVLTEHISRFDGADGGYWTELDAAMNVALSELPVNLTCFYPDLPLHGGITAGARRNHELLLRGGQLWVNSEYRAPREVLAELPVAGPTVLGPPDLRLQFGAWQLHEVRAEVQQALVEAGCEVDHAEDVVLAINELTTNAVEHGEREAELSLWTGDQLICEVHDHGVLRDPLPGLQAPHPAQPKGRGIWIARQLCDVLHVWGDADGTHVRVQTTR